MITEYLGSEAVKVETIESGLEVYLDHSFNTTVTEKLIGSYSKDFKYITGPKISGEVNQVR